MQTTVEPENIVDAWGRNVRKQDIIAALQKLDDPAADGTGQAEQFLLNCAPPELRRIHRDAVNAHQKILAEAVRMLSVKGSELQTDLQYRQRVLAVTQKNASAHPGQQGEVDAAAREVSRVQEQIAKLHRDAAALDGPTQVAEVERNRARQDCIRAYEYML